MGGEPNHNVNEDLQRNEEILKHGNKFFCC